MPSMAVTTSPPPANTIEDLRIASRIFSVLGQTNRSKDYWQQAEAVKAGINSNVPIQRQVLSGAARPEGNVSAGFGLGLAFQH